MRKLGEGSRELHDDGKVGGSEALQEIRPASAEDFVVCATKVGFTQVVYIAGD